MISDFLDIARIDQPSSGLVWEKKVRPLLEQMGFLLDTELSTDTDEYMYLPGLDNVFLVGTYIDDNDDFEFGYAIKSKTGEVKLESWALAYTPFYAAFDHSYYYYYSIGTDFFCMYTKGESFNSLFVISKCGDYYITIYNYASDSSEYVIVHDLETLNSTVDGIVFRAEYISTAPGGGLIILPARLYSDSPNLPSGLTLNSRVKSVIQNYEYTQMQPLTEFETEDGHKYIKINSGVYNYALAPKTEEVNT